MATELAGPVIRRDNKILSRIELMSITDRAKYTEAYVKIRVGIRHEGNTDWLGSHSGSSGGLTAGVPVALYADSRRVPKGSFPVVELTFVNSPPTVVGSAITFHYATDGTGRGSRRALVGVASRDQAIRSIVDQINASGLGESSVHIQLVDG